MNYRNVLIIIILLSAATWWFLHEDPEAEVRDAHQELSRLLSKAEGAASNTTILNAAVLKSMFADTCEVTGDAEMLVGAYTPEEMISTIVRVQGIFRSIELTFHELEIAFPAADDAIVNFTAVLVAQVSKAGEEEGMFGETRTVVSRMRKVDGKWLFAEFSLAKVPET